MLANRLCPDRSVEYNVITRQPETPPAMSPPAAVEFVPAHGGQLVTA